jgi:hypothetical protein
MAAPVPIATTINTYTRFYEETNWAAQSDYPGWIIQEFVVLEEGICKSAVELPA